MTMQLTALTTSIQSLRPSTDFRRWINESYRLLALKQLLGTLASLEICSAAGAGSTALKGGHRDSPARFVRTPVHHHRH